MPRSQKTALRMVVGFTVWISNAISVDAGVPQMFPTDHNLNSVEAGSSVCKGWYTLQFQGVNKGVSGAIKA